MSIMNAFLYRFVRYRRMRDRARTERLISELPFEIRKDIGWPGVYPTRLPAEENPCR